MASRRENPGLRSIGPAVVIAAVLCGPGSILTSSKIGAQLGYRAVWVLLLACLLMVAMISLASRVGIEFRDTPCGEIARRLGRPWAVLVGIVMFLIIACFQSGNNMAIAAGLEAFDVATPTWLAVGLLLIVNGAVIALLYVRRRLYGLIEQAMKLLVFLMVVAFLANGLVARPSLAQAARGLIPTDPGKDAWLLVALMGTTFSVAAAFYQAYLAREKGWGREHYGVQLWDTIIGVVTLGGISLVIMMTSAAVFFDRPEPVSFASAADVAQQLKPLFGTWAQVVFGIGILAGALSSFLVNGLIGGHILADGLGWGDRIDSPWTRHFTTAALLVGMVVALLSVATGMSRVTLIVFAQALTVLGVPALGAALIFLGSSRNREAPGSIPAWILAGAWIGFLVTGIMAVRTVMTILRTVSAS